MTDTELIFYNKIKTLEANYNYKIVPQINMASFIDKKINRNTYIDLFKNIDYAIFNEDYSKLLCLIELNDSTHNQSNRIKRDKKVKNICETLNIPLLTFYTNKLNENNYVLNRIINTIKD